MSGYILTYSRLGLNAFETVHNAIAHTAAATVDYLEANCVHLVTQIPYSSGLASCDFFLLPQVKQQLKGKQLQGVEDARAFFEGVITDRPDYIKKSADSLYNLYK